ncbi:phage tail terminator family protein [Lacrimispora algidixylanolytica]|uniref:Uncharacterized protein n=1 Tax=Lacrimispora algidixylanolytica TaxID=94868 RepID=A0A419T6I7_9FIRM|nr:hypothetical protein [Lacrimispora algidixylanolytica]RKD33091.1 hypothetical protein BET01_15875 [Lacrimispora algidixylanolytica]
MTFTIEKLIGSIIGVLKEQYPDIQVYSNLSHQSPEIPCFFLSLMPVETENRIGRRLMRKISIDVVFMGERGNQDESSQLTSIADRLDLSLEYIPYETGKLRTYNREWKIDNEELHYQFTVKVTMSYPDDTPLIESLETYKGGVNQYGNK